MEKKQKNGERIATIEADVKNLKKLAWTTLILVVAHFGLNIDEVGTLVSALIG